VAFDKLALRSFIEAGSQSFRENTVSFILYCPYCGKEKLYIRKEDGYFKCWKCAETENFKGHADYAFTLLYGGKLEEYRAILYGEVGGPLQRLNVALADHWGEEEAPIEVPPLIVDWEWSPMSVRYDSPEFERGRIYLNGRGISDAIIEKYDIRYSPWENRVQFPFIVNGKLAGWQGRLCSDVTEITNSATGKTTKISKAMTTLQQNIQGRYFMFGDGIRGSKHVVLCEGPVDALKADLCGGNVASLGKAVTPYQLEYIGTQVDRLYVALDPDAADEMARLTRQKRLGLEIFILPPPAGCKDLGAAAPEAVYEEFRTAKQFYSGQVIVNVGGQLCY
jgi:hypothetical protein